MLSERSVEFEHGLRRWRDLVDPAPDVTAIESRFVAQTLLGAWPLTDAELPAFTTRVQAYLTKALREAKQSTSWTRPDEDHERRVIACALRSIRGDAVRHAFGTLVDDVMFFGALGSLAVLTWKLGLPGTPDVYRGCELWDFSLVDPDNRRPVDFDLRRDVLDRIADDDPDGLLTDWRSGAIKMHVTARGLRARRDYPDLFLRGDYIPLDAPPGVLAYARQLDGAWAVAIAPRLVAATTPCGRWPIGREVWGDATVTLPDTDRTTIALAEALDRLPVALVVMPRTGR